MKRLNPFLKYYNTFPKLILSFSVFWLSFNFSFAQTQIPDLIEATDELPFQNTIPTTNSELELIQQGNLNHVSITQSRNFQNGLANQAVLNQSGNQNNMDIIQTSSNAIIMATQNGNNNHVDLIANGENLNLTTWQSGNNNKIKQTLTQSTNVELTLIQNGNNHIIDQTFNNKNGLDMTIIQTGQNAKIIVDHN